MKTKRLSLTAILLIFASTFTACNGEEPEIEIFPQEISITEFSLTGDACQWVSFEAGKVIVINSTDELRDFILCRDDGRFFHIDFSRYSFLLLKGSAESAVFYIDIDFSKQAAKEYTLNLTIHTDVSGVAQTWIRAGIVPKISNRANITLNTQELQDNACAEVYLRGTRWRLIGIVDTATGLITRPGVGLIATIRFDRFLFFPGHPTAQQEFGFSAETGSNVVWGNYEFDCNTCTYLFINPFRHEFLGNLEIERLTQDAFRRVQFFTLRNTQPRILLLHYNDGKNIIKYKEIE